MSAELVIAFLLVGALIAGIGDRLNRVVFGGEPRAGRKGWRGVYYLALPLIPPLVGVLVGAVLTHLPAPEGLRIAFYGCAGLFSSTAFNLVGGFLKHRAAQAITGEAPP